MISMQGVSSAGAAFSYFSEKDDYYRADASSAEWHGQGAALVGLTGDVAAQDFRGVLEGRIGGAQVGHAETHAPGWDITFSAPKSYSVAALVNRDDRLVKAHDQATRAALDHIERDVLATRQRGFGGRYDYRLTDSMVAAVFRHASSRNHDPQLHSHAVLANATCDPVTGTWVSVHSRDIYQAQVEAGAVYTNELARGAREAGYTVDWSVNGSGNPTFELREVPQSVRDAYSSRSAEKEAQLIARGIDPLTASAKAKEAAVLDTRSAKEHIPATELHARWRDQVRETGYNSNSRPVAIENSQKSREAAAYEAIRAGIAHLAERESRFTERALMHEARVASQGRAGNDDLKSALRSAWARGELIHRATWQRGPGNERVQGVGLTTHHGIETERSMLRHAEHIDQQAQGASRIGEHAGHAHSTQSIDERIERREQATGHELTSEQRIAVHGILRGESGLHVVQGHAGTAKTTTVLATVAEVAREGGWEVRAMAPTGSAAQSLGNAIGTKGETVAAVLNGPPTVGANQRAQAWIVDEAGMVSAKDMNALLAVAEKQQARVLLVGDERQIGSVAAGAAFAQIKAQYPANTYELKEIKRQTSTQLKSAVYDAIRGDMKEALGKVHVTEQRDRLEAIALIADRYQEHVEGGRNTLVVTLSRDDRRDANAAIQSCRIEAGDVRNVQALRVLDSKQWTPAQQADAARYQAGDVIQAGRNFKNGPQRGEAWTVTQSRDGRVSTQGERGQWSFDPKRVNAFRVHTAREQAIGEGDRVVAKANLFARDTEGASVKLRTGEMLDVRKIDGGHLEVTRGNGQSVTLDTRRGLNIDLGYAQTANQAQGKTSDAVVGYMRSSQTNLADQTRAYVTLSRAKEHADIVTDNKQRLANTLEGNPGVKETAKLNGLEANSAKSDTTAMGDTNRGSTFEPPSSRDTGTDLDRDHGSNSADRGAGLARYL